MNLNGYNRYQAVRRGGLYEAVVRRTLDDRPFELRVTYIDLQGGKHEEFCRSYKTASSAFGKLKRYFRGEEVEWRSI